MKLNQIPVKKSLDGKAASTTRPIFQNDIFQLRYSQPALEVSYRKWQATNTLSKLVRSLVYFDETPHLMMCLGVQVWGTTLLTTSAASAKHHFLAY